MILIKYICVLSLLICSIQLQAADLRIAAAANLRYVLPMVTAAFEQKTEQHVSVSYAASGTLSTQIKHGAPFEVFLSASPRYIDILSETRLIEGKVIDFAQAQIALFSSKQSTLSLGRDLLGLKLALEEGQLRKVAIANPMHAPFGQAAQQLLEQAGLWQKIQAQLLIAENASQTMQFSLSNQVDVGFVPYSYMFQPQLSSKGRFIKLDLTLPQQAVLIRGASRSAIEFLDFIQSAQVKEIFRQQGFAVQEEVS